MMRMGRGMVSMARTCMGANYRYRITPEFLTVIQSISDNENCVCEESASLAQFLYKHDTLSNLYASKKRMQKMPVKINDKDFTFSVCTNPQKRSARG